jgi:hypothetical protein
MEENLLIDKYNADIRFEKIDITTFCTITLQNGFIVTGQSIPQNKNEYSFDLGKKYALEDAKNKLIVLDAFREKEFTLVKDKIMKNVKINFINEYKRLLSENKNNVIAKETLKQIKARFEVYLK